MQPPESPFDPPPNYAAGPPAGPPYGPAPGLYEAPQPRNPQLSFDAISEAWQMLISNWSAYVGATLVLFLITGIISGALFYWAWGPTIGAAVASASTNSAPPNTAAIQYTAPNIIFRFVSGFLQWVITAALINMAVQHIRTGHADMSQAFKSFASIPSLLASWIMMLLAVLGGICLCIVPGLLLAASFIFAPPLMTDQKMGPIEALTTSFTTLRSQIWMAVAFMIVVNLLSSFGFVLCCVGLLFTMPLAAISYAIAYRDFFIPESIPQRTYYPSGPPIADPRGGM